MAHDMTFLYVLFTVLSLVVPPAMQLVIYTLSHQ